VLVSDYSTSIIPYGTCLPEAKGFTACSQGLSEATPLENARTTHPGRDASSVSLSLGTTTGVVSVAGTPSGVQTRLLGTRGVARASLNPGLMAEIPSGCEKTKSDSNLKPPYLNPIRS
jgi:hypothetical protein